MTAAAAVPGSRKCQIALLDGRHLDISVQPRMYAGDLFDLVCSNFNLKEKEYFGLFFTDDTNHPNWLMADRKVLEHDLPRSKDGSFTLCFAVRFYAESIAHIQDTVTIELFYYQACLSVYQGTVECDSDTVFELAGHSLQAAIGDFSEDWYQRGGLRKFALIPTQTLREHPSMQYCENRVAASYRSLQGQSRGQSIVNYMSIVEGLPTYGIHYYEVKDKGGIPWWLGLSYKGIAQYDHSDKRTPRRVFPWKQLENLYFRDKKFSIEVQDPKRVVHALSSFNLYEEALREPADEYDDLSDAISHPTTQISVSRRTFGPSNVTVCAWFASKPQLTKCIWSMAVCQHQFYLDRRQSKSHLPPARSLSEIASSIPERSEVAANMTGQSPDKVPGSDLLRESIRNTLASSKEKGLTSRLSKVNLMSPEELEAKQKAYRQLKARRDDVQAALHEKLLELRAICLREASLTGSLPVEYPLAPGEKKPVVPRRVGTSFSIANKIAEGASGLDHDEPEVDAVGAHIQQLELQCEIQRQITRALMGLVNDTSLSKGVRKKHRANYQEMREKLKELEAQVRQTRRACGLGPPDSLSLSSGEHDLRSIHSSPASVRRGLPSPTTRHVKKVASTPQFEPFEQSPGSRRRNSASSRTLASRRSVSPPLSTPQSTRSRRLSGGIGGTSASQPNVNRLANDDAADHLPSSSPSGHFATIAASYHSPVPSARRRLDTAPASALTGAATASTAPLATAEMPAADTLSLGGSSVGSTNSYTAGAPGASAASGASCLSTDGSAASQLSGPILAPPPAFSVGGVPLQQQLPSSSGAASLSRATPPILGNLLSPHTLSDSGSTSSLAQVHVYSVSSGRPLRSGSVNDVSATAAGGSTDSIAAAESGTSFPAAATTASVPPMYQSSQLYSAHASSMASGGASQRNKELYANNPYGSLERKGLRSRRSVRASLESPAAMPAPCVLAPGSGRDASSVYGASLAAVAAATAAAAARGDQALRQHRAAQHRSADTGASRHSASSASSSPGAISRSSANSWEDRRQFAAPSHPAVGHGGACAADRERQPYTGSDEPTYGSYAEQSLSGSGVVAAVHDSNAWSAGGSSNSSAAIMRPSAYSRPRAAQRVAAAGAATLEGPGHGTTAWSSGGGGMYGAGSSSSLHSGYAHLPPPLMSVSADAAIGGADVEESPSGSPRASAFSFDVRVHHSPSQQDLGAAAGAAVAAPTSAGFEPRVCAVRRSNSHDSVGSVGSAGSGYGAVRPPLSPFSPSSHEESKPFEMTDYYKYSERLRQRRAEQQAAPGAASAAAAPERAAGFQTLPSHPPFARPRVPSPSGSAHDGGGSRPASPFSMFAAFHTGQQPPPPVVQGGGASAQPRPTGSGGQWHAGGGSRPAGPSVMATAARGDTRWSGSSLERPESSSSSADGVLAPEQDRHWHAGHRPRRSDEGVPADGGGRWTRMGPDGNSIAWYPEKGRGGSATLV